MVLSEHARLSFHYATHLPRIAGCSSPALHILEAAIRLRSTCLTLRLDICTLIIAFDGDVLIVRDPKSLGCQAVVALPDLQTNTVDTSLRAKVGAVVGRGQVVRRDSDLGSALCVYELLKGEVRRGGGEAFGAGARNDQNSSAMRCARREILHGERRSVLKLPKTNSEALLLTFHYPLDGLALTGRRRRCRSATADNIPDLGTGSARGGASIVV